LSRVRKRSDWMSPTGSLPSGRIATALPFRGWGIRLHSEIERRESLRNLGGAGDPGDHGEITGEVARGDPRARFAGRRERRRDRPPKPSPPEKSKSALSSSPSTSVSTLEVTQDTPCGHGSFTAIRQHCQRISRASEHGEAIMPVCRAARTITSYRLSHRNRLTTSHLNRYLRRELSTDRWPTLHLRRDRGQDAWREAFRSPDRTRSGRPHPARTGNGGRGNVTHAG